MASITVRPVSGRNTRASRLLIPQSREPDPFRKKPGLGGGTPAKKFLASPSASGITPSPYPAHRPLEGGTILQHAHDRGAILCAHIGIVKGRKANAYRAVFFARKAYASIASCSSLANSGRQIFVAAARF